MAPIGALDNTTSKFLSSPSGSAGAGGATRSLRRCRTRPAEPGDVAPNVLCPGDPAAPPTSPPRSSIRATGRSTRSAACRLHGHVRGASDHRAVHGDGCPSAGIVFEELIQLGARRMIRVGTCGGLAGIGLRLRTPSSRSRRPARTPHHCATPTAPAGRRPPRRPRRLGGAHGRETVRRSTWSRRHGSLFYDPDLTNVPRWSRLATSDWRWRPACSTPSPPSTASRRWR